MRTQNTAGESALGNLIADAQRAALETDFAFMNPGGIRADLLAGPVTWGELFTIQPFGNSVIKMELTGQQIYDLLNQQWLNQPVPRMLQISGLTYTWDNSRPVGDRVVEVRKDGVLLSLATPYSLTANSFIAAGGDNFTVLTQGVSRVGGPIDLDALIAHIQSLPQPFTAAMEGRILRLNWVSFAPEERGWCVPLPETTSCSRVCSSPWCLAPWWAISASGWENLPGSGPTAG